MGSESLIANSSACDGVVELWLSGWYSDGGWGGTDLLIDG